MKEDWSIKEGSTITHRGKASRLVERFTPSSITTPHLLDVGSGNGFFIDTLPLRFAVDAVDGKNFLSEQARTRVGSFVAQDLNSAWLFQDRVYDAVTLWNVLEHLENPFHFAREAARVLKDGGILFVSIPNVFNLRSRLQFLFSGEMPRYHHNNSHLTPFTHTTLQKIFTSFTPVASGFWGYEFPFRSKHFRIPFTKRFLKHSKLFGQTAYFIFQKPKPL